MLNLLEMLVPALVIALILLPLVSVFKGTATKASAKRRLITHVCLFFGVVAATLALQITGAHAATADAPTIIGTNAQGMGFLAAALATGLG